ncbi:MAG: hypothetical protein F7B06_01250 [Opitutae bacterium]|nr:hypothetical protein [Opitutae bacterium]MBC9888483.1 hypothetical protein [Opitutae bacterium]
MNLSRFFRFAAVGSLGLLPAEANAQTIDQARAAFEEGRFLEAADLAESLGTSAGYALAAQSLAVYGHYVAQEEDRIGFLESAMELGEAAVRADSTNPEAHYQSSHAVGRYAQSIGKISALGQGLAGKIRRLLEATLDNHPDFAEAHVGLGGWHADIASAGPFARMMYGANRKSAVVHYERALELAPDSKVVLLEYGIRLPELDRKGGLERARELLSKAVELPVRNAHEEFIQQEVVQALEKLKMDR